MIHNIDQVRVVYSIDQERGLIEREESAGGVKTVWEVYSFMVSFSCIVCECLCCCRGPHNCSLGVEVERSLA